MVESFNFLVPNYGLKLEILASEVTQASMLLRQGKPVNESVCGQLILGNQSHGDWIIQLMQNPSIFINLGRINILCDERVDWHGMIHR